MFKKFTRAVTGGKSSGKFKLDVQLLQLENLPSGVKRCRVVWARSAKVQVSETRDADKKGTAVFKQTLTQIATLYKDGRGGYEPKEYSFKVQVPGKESGELLTIGKADVDMCRYISSDSPTQNARIPIQFKVGKQTTGHLIVTVVSTLVQEGSTNDDAGTDVSGLTGITSNQETVVEQDLEGFDEKEERRARAKKASASAAAAAAAAAAAEPERRPPGRRPVLTTMPEEDEDISPVASDLEDAAPMRHRAGNSRTKQNELSFEDAKAALFRGAKKPSTGAPSTSSGKDGTSQDRNDRAGSSSSALGKKGTRAAEIVDKDDASSEEEPAQARPASTSRAGAKPDNKSIYKAPNKRVIEEDDDSEEEAFQARSTKPSAKPPQVETKASAKGPSKKITFSPEVPVVKDDEDDDSDDSPELARAAALAAAGAKWVTNLKSRSGSGTQPESSSSSREVAKGKAEVGASSKRGVPDVDLDEPEVEPPPPVRPGVSMRGKGSKAGRESGDDASREAPALEDAKSGSTVLALRSQLAAAEEAKKALEARNQELEASLDSYEARIDELEDALAQAGQGGGGGSSASLAELEARYVAQLAAAEAKMKGVQEEANKKLRAANEMVDDSMMLATSNAVEMRALKEEVERYRLMHAAPDVGASIHMEEEMAALRAKVEALEAENEEYKQRTAEVDAMAGEMVARGKQVLGDDMVGDDWNKESSPLGRAALVCAALVDALNEHAAAIKAMEAKLEAKSNKLKTLKLETTTYPSIIAAQKQEIEELTRAKAELQRLADEMVLDESHLLSTSPLDAGGPVSKGVAEPLVPAAITQSSTQQAASPVSEGQTSEELRAMMVQYQEYFNDLEEQLTVAHQQISDLTAQRAALEVGFAARQAANAQDTQEALAKSTAENRALMAALEDRAVEVLGLTERLERATAEVVRLRGHKWDRPRVSDKGIALGFEPTTKVSQIVREINLGHDLDQHLIPQEAVPLHVSQLPQQLPRRSSSLDRAAVAAVEFTQMPSLARGVGPGPDQNHVAEPHNPFRLDGVVRVAHTDSLTLPVASSASDRHLEADLAAALAEQQRLQQQLTAAEAQAQELQAQLLAVLSMKQEGAFTVPTSLPKSSNPFSNPFDDPFSYPSKPAAVDLYTPQLDLMSQPHAQANGIEVYAPSTAANTFEAASESMQQGGGHADVKDVGVQGEEAGATALVWVNQVSLLEGQLAAAHAAAEALRIEGDSLRHELVEVRSAMEVLQASVLTSEDAITALKAEALGLEQQLQALRAREGELNEQVERLRELEQEGGAKGELRLDPDPDPEWNLRSNAMFGVELANGDVDGVEGDQTDGENESRELVMQNEHSKQSWQNGERTEAHESQRRENEELVAQNQELRRHIDELSQQFDELSQQVGTLSQQVDDLTGQVGELRQQNNGLKQENAELRQHREEMEASVGELKSLNAELTLQNAELTQHNDGLRLEMETHKQVSDDMGQHTGQVRQQFEQLQQHNEALQQQAASLTEQHSNLQQQSEELRREIEELREANEGLREENEERLEEGRQLQEQLEKALYDASTLQEMLDAVSMEKDTLYEQILAGQGAALLSGGAGTSGDAGDGFDYGYMGNDGIGMAAVQQQLAAAESQKTELLNAQDELRAEVQSLQARLASVNELAAEKEAAAAENRALLSRLAVMQAELEGTLHEHSVVQGQVEGLVGRYAAMYGLDSDVSAEDILELPLNAKASAGKAGSADSDDDVDGVVSMMKLQREKKAVERELSKSKALVVELTSVRGELERSVEELEDAVARGRVEVTRLQAQLGEAHRLNEQLLEQLSVMEAGATGTRGGARGGDSDDEELAEHNSQLQAQVSTLQSRLASAEAQVAEEKEERLRLLKQVEAAGDDDAAAEIIAAYEVKYNRLRERYRALEETSRAEQEALEEALESGQKQVEALAKQVKELTSGKERSGRDAKQVPGGSSSKELDDLRRENEQLVGVLVARNMELAEVSEREIVARRELFKLKEVNMKLASKMTKLETAVYTKK